LLLLLLLLLAVGLLLLLRLLLAVGLLLWLPVRLLPLLLLRAGREAWLSVGIVWRAAALHSLEVTWSFASARIVGLRCRFTCVDRLHECVLALEGMHHV
jgi:hypothetical protein